MENTKKLTAKELTIWRQTQLSKQLGLCGICHLPIGIGKAVADHDHATGHMRTVLHRGCNALLGKVENNYKRMGVSEEELANFAPNLYNYIKADYLDQPLHPTHGRKKKRSKLTKRKK